MFGGLSGVALIVLGILQLLGSAFNPQAIINGVYQLIFGVLAIIAELRLAQVLKHFKFLTHFLGLGLFYIFIGGLALGGQWYELLVAVVVLGVGILYCLLGCFCRKFGQEDFSSFNAQSAAPSDDERQAVLHNEVPSDAYQPPVTRPIPEESQHESSLTRSSSSSSKSWQPAAVDWSAPQVTISASTTRTAAAVAGYGNMSNEQASAAASAATVVANNPYARAGAAAAARSAVAGVAAGQTQEEVKKNAVESAIQAANPFADFH